MSGVWRILVAYAHVRWPVEQLHKDAKQVPGIDQFEGRTWRGRIITYRRCC